MKVKMRYSDEINTPGPNKKIIGCLWLGERFNQPVRDISKTIGGFIKIDPIYSDYFRFLGVEYINKDDVESKYFDYDVNHMGYIMLAFRYGHSIKNAAAILEDIIRLKDFKDLTLKKESYIFSEHSSFNAVEQAKKNIASLEAARAIQTMCWINLADLGNDLENIGMVALIKKKIKFAEIIQLNNQ